MKPIYTIVDLIISFCCGIVIMWLFNRAITVQQKYESMERENELQKQTIYRLNNQLSKMDTLHDECFKMSEIRNAKKK